MSNSDRWSPFQINNERSNGDSRNFHVYRAKKVDGKWEYDQRHYPRSLYAESSLLIAYLRTIEQAEQRLNESASKISNTESSGQGDSEEEEKAADSITASLQNLRIGTSPYHTPLANYSYNNNYPSNPHRSTTPHPSQSPYGCHYPANYQHTGLTPSPMLPGGYASPYSGPGLPLIPQYGGGFGPQIPSQSYGYAGQAGAALSDPRKLPRSATSAPPAVNPLPQSRPNLKGFKPLKPKDWRTFYKIGRVFKAFYAQATGQAPGSNNPFQAARSSNTFGEVLRFVVLRPHKYHSVCLAIHTYQNQGTTARHARARDHVVIYTGDRPPPLVPGEDQVILQRPPLKVVLKEKGEPLLPASRLNLTRLHTVDHTIAIVAVGKISSRDVELVKHYCIEVQGLFISPSGASQPLPNVNENEEDDEEDDEDEN